jgi:hypothetical protein
MNITLCPRRSDPRARPNEKLFFGNQQGHAQLRQKSAHCVQTRLPSYCLADWLAKSKRNGVNGPTGMYS